jgi:hypothetical protein
MRDMYGSDSPRHGNAHAQHTHFERRAIGTRKVNPNGIPPQSPGLALRLPWEVVILIPNPNGVASTCSKTMAQPRWG